ncbi:peptidyl-prolyl cis-trans isomerase cyclophilin type [Russula earlei]|uniref:Peptidyl-prolyl cis-trans isomerase cyclophilin type n=1 Tax=Russula earlei TaxID=71964 RepID=A0ACC0TQC6_9AGAM|nr:peptidyl-prolyl cis-trans isomerase cyclophilin type [Russula earlei]
MDRYKSYGSIFNNWLVIVLCLLAACRPAYRNPHIEIQTKLGDIEIELYQDKAPKTVAAFLLYIDSGLYRNASFYRILNDENQPSNAPKSELVQGGIWKTNYKKSASLPGIPHETTKQTGILHKDGVISLARQALGTATTEFFICVGDQPGFDYGGANNADGQGYAAFGKVVKGMNIIKQLYDAPEYEQLFDPPVDIYNIIRL